MFGFAFYLLLGLDNLKAIPPPVLRKIISLPRMGLRFKFLT
jgi:hypothetical protein